MEPISYLAMDSYGILRTVQTYFLEQRIWLLGRLVFNLSHSCRLLIRSPDACRPVAGVRAAQHSKRTSAGRSTQTRAKHVLV